MKTNYTHEGRPGKPEEAPKQDWQRLAEPVALDLLGDPNPRLSSAHEMRWGSKGSLALAKKTGIFFDHEANTGGGVLKLVEHVRNCGEADALQWLADAGFIESRRKAHGAVKRTRPPPESRSVAVQRSGDAKRPDPDRRQKALEVARNLWNAATADPAPVRAWLSHRGVWPPTQPLPGAVRFIERGPVQDLPWRVPVPDDAAGLAVYAFTDAKGKLTGVHLEALTESGRRTVPKWKFDRGIKAGSAFRILPPGRIRDGAGARPLAVCEGQADALAVATWKGRECWATGGAGGFTTLAGQIEAQASPGRIVEIHEDGDTAGRQAGLALMGALRILNPNRSIRRISAPNKFDPAQLMSEHWEERAAIIAADVKITANHRDRHHRLGERLAWKCWPGTVIEDQPPRPGV